MAPPINPSTHPPTKPGTHPWMGKSPQISNLETELNYLDFFKCYCIFSDLDSPQLWGRSRGWGHLGAWGYLPMHTHACTHAHAHVKHANKHDTNEGGHLQFLYMYI